MHSKHVSSAVCAVAAFVICAGTAAAQSNVDDKTIDKFAAALDAVKEIRVEYSEKIQQAREPAVANTLQREAQTEMVRAVEQEGLDTEQYNSLAQRFQDNPQFRERVTRAMNGN